MNTLKVPVNQRDHIRGPAEAPVTLVEYGDYECPHCGVAHKVVQLLRQQYGPRLGFVFRHFPLSQVHPNANAAAQTAEFAGSHGKFWQMHDELFDHQDRMGSALFFALAKALGLSNDKLRAALINGTFVSKVRDDFMGGIRSGVNGTPTFFVNGRRHEGTYALEDLGGAIEAALRVHAPT